MNSAQVSSSLSSHYPNALIQKLIQTFEEMRTNYYLGKLRINEVEGGRFCEAAFRMLEFDRTGVYTSLATQINTQTIIQAMSQLPANSLPDSLRLHIPRMLRVVYDIRNNRDAGHLADGISANEQDASVVVSCCSWVLSEFLRLHHNMTADETYIIIEDLVERRAPSIQEFGTFLKTLKPNLSVSNRILLLLYKRGKEGASFDELFAWLHHNKPGNLKTALKRLEISDDLLHFDGDKYLITQLGERHVEKRKLFNPD